MQRIKLNYTLQKTLEGEFKYLYLLRCHQCGECSGICPSYRNGGINIRELMERVRVGAFDLDKDVSIWQCTMCNSCSERCQMNVDPAYIITLLRNLAAERGNIPAHFLSEVRLFAESGFAFPISGLTKKLRRDLGLDEMRVEKNNMEDIRKIISRTRLGRLTIER